MGGREGPVENVVTSRTMPAGFHPAFWTERRVLVTGHTGFKGAWLLLMLKQLGAEVHGLALAPSTDPALFIEAGLGEGPGSFRDIRDGAATRSAFAATAPEIVIHMAAQALVRPSYHDPIKTYSTNVMGTINVLEAVRATPSVRAVVVVTSDKCYRNQEWDWAYREDEPLGGHDPYSSSKACEEIVTESWRSSFFQDGAVAIGSARAGNVIGGGDWSPDRIIVDCAKAFIAGQPVQLRRPGSIRPWQHVLEPLAGYLTLAQALIETGDAAQAWNFGPYEADAIRVDTLVDRFAAAWGGGAQWTAADGEHLHEAGTLRIDAAKARERLGWRPLLNVGEAVAWSADWYRRWAAGEGARALCDEQIGQYLSRLAR